MASNTMAGSTPAFCARVSASASAWMLQATMIWLASLVVLPAPTSPQRTTEAPMADRIGLQALKVSSSPPTIKDSVPSMAFGSPPETGASSILTPFSARAAAISLLATGLMELQSIKVAPAFMWAATPSAPSITSLTWGELGSIVMTTSHWSPISCWVAAVAPQAASSSIGAAERLLTSRSV